MPKSGAFNSLASKKPAKTTGYLQKLEAAVAESEKRTSRAKRRMDEALDIFAGRIADGSETVHYPDGTTCTAWAKAGQRYIDRTVNTFECEAWALAESRAALDDARGTLWVSSASQVDPPCTDQMPVSQAPIDHQVAA